MLRRPGKGLEALACPPAGKSVFSFASPRRESLRGTPWPRRILHLSTGNLGGTGYLRPRQVSMLTAEVRALGSTNLWLPCFLAEVTELTGL